MLLFFKPEWSTEITDNTVREPNIGELRRLQGASSTVAARDIDRSEVHHKAGDEY